MHEGECLDIRNSETSLRKVTNDDHLVPKHNVILEHVRRDPHAPAHKGNLDIVEILLGRDAHPNPNSIGWTQKARVKQPKNKSICDQKMSCENEKLDEYRIEIAEPEILDLDRNGSTRNTRQDGIRSIKFPLEKTNTNSNSRNSNCPSDRESARLTKKRVTIHLLHSRSTSRGQHGKLIILPDSLQELLKIAGKLCPRVKKKTMIHEPI